MPGLQIRPFSDDDVDDAASPLARRHADHRETEPLLPDDVDVRAQIEGEWRAEGASGVFATRGGFVLRGTSDDLVDAARLDRAMTDSMFPSPSFSGMSPPTPQGLRPW